MAQQRNTISIFSALFDIFAVNAEYRLFRGEDNDHFECIMQNKANFRKDQMNINIFIRKDYENQSILRLFQNKPKQSQFVYFTAENAELAKFALGAM